MRLDIRGLFGLKRKSGQRIPFLHESNSSRLEQVPWYPDGQELSLEDLQLLHSLRQELNDGLAPEEAISHRDVLRLALQELLLALRSASREDKILRLLFYLSERREECET